MKPLMDKYPRLFQGEPSLLGLGLPLGWFAIMDEALAQIDALLDDEQASKFSVDQVKEKFGVLRVHLGLQPVLIGREENGWPIYEDDQPSDELVSVMQAARKFTNAASQKSAYTCAACSAPGRLRSPATGDAVWMLTLCDACNRIPRRELVLYPAESKL